MNTIWDELSTPILALAPMEGVTDTAFRRVLMHASAKPTLMFTEFTSVDGLFSRGFDYVGKRLEFEKPEKPLIAQIWGSDPEYFYKAGKLLCEMGFDGVDINMGCPEKNVVKKGLCSALVLNKPLAKEMIQATKEGVAGELPVSVKIRIGYAKVETEEWAEYLLNQEIAALTVHGRTTKQMSIVPADWDEIGKVVRVRDKLGVATKILGNGDVMSMKEANEKADTYGVDGVMIGRGIFHNPWLFAGRDPESIGVDERVHLLMYHVDLFESVWDGRRPFHELRRFFKIYINSFDGAKELRVALMETQSKADVMQVLTSNGYL